MVELRILTPSTADDNDDVRFGPESPNGSSSMIVNSVLRFSSATSAIQSIPDLRAQAIKLGNITLKHRAGSSVLHQVLFLPHLLQRKGIVK